MQALSSMAERRFDPTETLVRFQEGLSIWISSSFGRASLSHGEGARFEPGEIHPPHTYWGTYWDGRVARHRTHDPTSRRFESCSQ